MRTTNDVYKDLEDYNPTKKSKLSIVFSYKIEDTKSDKKLSPIVTELFWRGRKH